MMENGDLGVCTPFLLEAGWSARSGAGHDELLADLLRLAQFKIDADVEETAIAAQRDLAYRGRHRTASPADLLIAACAHRYAAGVLHYDHDYEILVQFTALDFGRNGSSRQARSNPDVQYAVRPWTQGFARGRQRGSLQRSPRRA